MCCVCGQTLQLLVKSEQRWEGDWGRQRAALDRDHVALWHLYSTKHMTALDYLTYATPLYQPITLSPSHSRTQAQP